MATAKKTVKKPVKVAALVTPADNKKGVVLAFAIGSSARVPFRAYAMNEADAIKALKQRQPAGGYSKDHGITIRYQDGTSKRIDF